MPEPTAKSLMPSKNEIGIRRNRAAAVVQLEATPAVVTFVSGFNVWAEHDDALHVRLARTGRGGFGSQGHQAVVLQEYSTLEGGLLRQIFRGPARW